MTVNLVPLYQHRMNLYVFEYAMPGRSFEVEAWNVREARRAVKQMGARGLLVRFRRFDQHKDGWRLR